MNEASVNVLENEVIVEMFEANARNWIDMTGKRFFVDCFYSINIDENRLICENGEDFSGLMVNPEILLSLGINRTDVVYLDHNGYWKRFPDYMNVNCPGAGRFIDGRCIKYVQEEVVEPWNKRETSANVVRRG